jgi:hypothetical protein
MVWNRVIWSGYVPVVGSCEHGNEPLGSGRVRNVLGSWKTRTSTRRALLYDVRCDLKKKCLYQKSECYWTAVELKVSMKYSVNWHFHRVRYSMAFES